MAQDNQAILEKAIQKAIEGGWKPDIYNQEAIDAMKNTIPGMWSVFHIIFNHNFAKALWGEEPEYAYKRSREKLEAGKFIPWQSHLQAMVIAEDPITYLGEQI